MEKSIECEAKCLITKNEYQSILQACSVSKTIHQTNYYLDYDNQLKNNHQALRIRAKNDNYELTLKTKTSNGNIEQTINIDASCVANIINNHYLPTQLASEFNINISAIDSIKTIKTTRSCIKYHNLIVELDHTDFNGTIDYEIEIEGPNLKIANETLDRFCNEHNINPQPSMPKIARYDLYN